MSSGLQHQNGIMVPILATWDRRISLRGQNDTEEYKRTEATAWLLPTRRLSAFSCASKRNEFGLANGKQWIAGHQVAVLQKEKRFELYDIAAVPCSICE